MAQLVNSPEPEYVYPQQGDILLHKNGNYYKVLALGVRHSETQENMVIYQALYDDYTMWVRPWDMFTKDRFTLAISSDVLANASRSTGM